MIRTQRNSAQRKQRGLQVSIDWYTSPPFAHLEVCKLS